MSWACTADEEVTPEAARTLELGRSMIEGEQQPVTPATSEYGQVCIPRKPGMRMSPDMHRHNS